MACVERARHRRRLPSSWIYQRSVLYQICRADPSMSACGESGCCVTSALTIAPCNATSAAMEITMAADNAGLVQLRFENCSGKSCCLANINGHSNPTCSAATAWQIQRGYAGNQTVLQTADDRGCLTVSAKPGAKIKPGMGKRKHKSNPVLLMLVVVVVVVPSSLSLLLLRCCCCCCCCCWYCWCPLQLISPGILLRDCNLVLIRP